MKNYKNNMIKYKKKCKIIFYHLIKILIIGINYLND